jgi:murein DD-endopeptidase MepM/ murein hydrolase activator NlpD
MTKKILSALLCLIMACSPLAVIMSSADTTTDSYKKQISDLQAKEKKYQEELNKTKSDIKDKEAYSKTLVKQIEVLSSEISTYHKQITELNSSIAEKQSKINKAKKKIEKQMNALKKRIRNIYMAGDTSDLDIILGAKDFSDFLDKYELIETLSDYDQKLISTIQKQLETVSDEKAELVSQRKEQEDAESLLQKKQDKLNTLLDKNESVLSSLYDDKDDAQAKMDKLNAQESEIQSQLSAYNKKIEQAKSSSSSSSSSSSGSSSSSSGGSGSSSTVNVSSSGYTWPVPGYYYVISTFNENRGYSHKGVDITGGGIMGATVVAAASGTVIASNNSCSHNWGKSGSCGCGGGYGNYVLISHANGKTTLYGHLSSTTVSTGSSVSKGQTIGYVGSTGWSTGAHLHFEARLNGSVYNPMSEY